MAINTPRGPKKNKKKNAGQSEASSSMQELLAKQQAEQADAQIIPAERLQLSAALSQEINNKVQGLVGGLKKLKQLTTTPEPDEGAKAFLEENQQLIESLLSFDLPGHYNKLIGNHDHKLQIIKALSDKYPQLAHRLQLLMGVLSPEPYHQLIAKLGQRDPAATPALPSLSPADQENLQAALNSNIVQIVGNLKNDNKITQSEADQLISLGPKTDEQIAHARTELLTELQRLDLQNKTDYLRTYQNIDNQDKAVIAKLDDYTDKYNQVTESLVKQIQEMYDQNENKQTIQSRLDRLSHDLGLPIKEGAVYGVVDPYKRDQNPDAVLPKNYRLEITKIGNTGEEVDPFVGTDTGARSATLEPVIHFTVTSDTDIANLKLSATAFKRFAIDNQMGQSFSSVAALEKELGIFNFIKPGQVLDYLEPKPIIAGGEPGFVNRQVTIEKIQDAKVFLSEPVILDRPVGQGTLVRNRRVKELEFGDFARWFRKADVMPEITDLGELDAALAQHHQQLVTANKWPADKHTPIQFSNFTKPFYLISSKNPDTYLPFKVTGISPEGISIEGIENPITPAAFLRDVRNQDLTIPNSAQLDVLMEQAAAKKEDQRLEKLSKVADEIMTPEQKAAKADPKKNPQPESVGYWKNLWNNTTFLSLLDMYEVFIKAPTDRLKAWFKDRAERRQMQVGKEFYKGMPTFGGLGKLATTYEDSLNGKNGKDVTDKIDYYEKNLEPKDVLKQLHGVAGMKEFKTAKTQFKAALTFLGKKGMLRFEDDAKLRDALNNLARLRPGGPPGYPEHLRHNIDANTPVIIGDQDAINKGIDIFTQYQVLIDEIYGTGSYDSIARSNDSEYDRQKKEAVDNYHRYEFISGSVNTLLQTWLDNWSKGEPVDAAIFEGLLTKAIEGNEISHEQGMMYFFAAFGMQNPEGRTILTYSRLNKFIGPFGNHVLYMYFAQSSHEQLTDDLVPMKDSTTGTVKTGKFKTNNFRKVFKETFTKDIKVQETEGKTGSARFTAGKHTINWIQSECIGSKLVKKLVSKRAPGAPVEVMHFVGPLMSNPTDLNKVLRSGYGGREENSAIYNLYAGYGNQLMYSAQKLTEYQSGSDEAKAKAKDLANMIFGFTYFHNTVSSRIHPGDSWMHFRKKEYNEVPPIEKTKTVGAFAQEGETFVVNFAKGVARMANNSELAQQIEYVFNSAKPIDENIESEFRDNLQSTIVELAQTNYMDLATLAQSCSQHMTGLSGTQFTAEERRKMKEGSEGDSD